MPLPEFMTSLQAWWHPLIRFTDITCLVKDIDLLMSLTPTCKQVMTGIKMTAVPILQPKQTVHKHFLSFDNIKYLCIVYDLQYVWKVFEVHYQEDKNQIWHSKVEFKGITDALIKSRSPWATRNFYLVKYKVFKWYNHHVDKTLKISA